MSPRTKQFLSLATALALLGSLAVLAGGWTSGDEDFTGPIPDEKSSMIWPDHVYILILDGMGAGYVNSRDTPNLAKLTTWPSRLQGWKAYTAAPAVLPSVTSTNHTAILTSARAGKSGILGAVAAYSGLEDSPLPRIPPHATFKTFDSSDLETVSLFQIVKQQRPDLKTAMVSGKSWIVDLFAPYLDVQVTGATTTADYGWITPRDGYVLGGPPSTSRTDRHTWWCVEPAEGGDPSPDCGDLLSGGNRHAFRVPTVLKSEHFPSSRWIKEMALEVIRQEDPFLLYVVFQTPDTAGHFYGAGKEGSPFYQDPDILNLADPRNLPQLVLKPNPTAIRNEVKTVDRLVGELIQDLKDLGKFDRSILVITADHGMTTSSAAASGKFDLRSELEAEGWRMQAQDDSPDPGGSGGYTYDWCGSEGPVAYIYGITSGDSRDLMKKWLATQPEVLRVVDTSADETYGLKDQRTRTAAAVPWPDLIVFFENGYYCPIYPDQLRGGANAVGLTFNIYGVQGYAPGLHGSESTQMVPLFFRLPGFAWWKSRQPRTIDIVPTILQRFGLSRERWVQDLGMEGRYLLFFYF